MTTPEPVSPAPDTEALRQQVLHALCDAYNEQCATEPGKDVARPEEFTVEADAVLSLPWIKYAAGQRHVVTMHERNNAAIAETNRQFAEENAGLRADLDQARQDWRAMGRRADERWDEIERLRRQVERLTSERDAYRDADRQSQSNWRGAVAANMTALETIATLKRALVGHLFDGESVSTREAVRNELIEQALASGARPIPDDAAERLAAVRALHREYRIFDACGHQHTENEAGVDYVEEVGLVCQDGYEYSICLECCTRGGEHQSEECATTHERACWPCSTAKAVDGATPTTGPAPAAADVQWGVRFGDGEVVQQSGEEPARAYAEWQNQAGETKTPVELVSRTVSVWTPAAPQAPAEPSEEGGHRVAVKRSTTDRLFWMADCKDCPDSYGGDARKVADWAVGHSIATTPPAGPAAREDAATPDDDGYNSNLTAGFLRAPVGACSCQPTAAVIHVPGTYCGDEQYEQAVDAMRATVGRPGDERDEEAVSAVLGYLANPTPEEKQ